MYRKTQQNEKLETLLKESLTVNSIEVKRPQRSQSHSFPLRRGVPSRTVKYDLFVDVKDKKPNVIVQEKCSTLDFVEKLKQIEGTNHNNDFLKQANEEINTAYLQLLEIQRLIQKKISEGTSEAEIEETKRRRKTVINNCNRQLERMQKKYLNKTRIRYKSVQDFENVTLTEKEQKLKIKPSDSKEVEVLLTPKKVFPINSVEEIACPKTLTKLSIVSPLNNKKIIEEKLRAILNDESSRKRPKLQSQTNRIRYLLKPEHHTDETRSEATQMNNTRTRSILKKHFGKHTVPKNESKTLQRVQFDDAPFNHSILKPDFLSFANIDQSQNEIDDVFEEEQEDQKESKPKEERQSLKDLKAVIERFKKCPLPFRSIKETKVDEATDPPKEPFSEGRKKLNLLLYGRDKLFDEVGDSELVDSVLKSAYLSKEFVGPKLRFSNKTKPDSKMQLFESVIHKFRQLESSQLANLKRDQQTYPLLSTALKDTLYSGIQK